MQRGHGVDRDRFFTNAIGMKLMAIPAGEFLMSLAGSRISDDGLPTLKKMSGLRSLRLEGTRVSVAAIAELRKALPKCEISATAQP